MTIRLRQDALLSVGTGFEPVDLVIRSTGRRLPLSAEEAAVALLLTYGADADTVIHMVHQHGVGWDAPQLRAFLGKLRDLDALEGELAPVEASLAAEPVEEFDEPTDQRYFDGGETVVDTDFARGLLADEAAVTDEADGNWTVPWDESDTPVESGPPVTGPIPLPRQVTGPLPLRPPPAAAVTGPMLPRPRPAEGPTAQRPVRRAARSGPSRPEPLAPVQTGPPEPIPPPPAPPRPPPAPPRPTATGGRPAARVGRVPAAPAPPAMPAGPPAAAAMRPLALAALKIRDGEISQAEALLQQALVAEPANAQVAAMLELIAGLRRRERETRKVRWLIPLAVVAAVLVGGLTALLLIKVPDRVKLTCRQEPVSRQVLRSSIPGTVVSVLAQPGERIAAGQAVMEIRDLGTEKRRVFLREELASGSELLEIMRTGGTDQIEARQRQRLTELQRKLKVQGECSSEACQTERRELERQIEGVKTKLKFCEWQALPREVEEQEQKLEKQRQELRGLEGRSTTARVVSPRAGQLAWALPGGQSVTRGQRVAELVTASQLAYLAEERGRAVPPGTPATVQLGGGGLAKVLLGRTAAGSRPGVVRVLVPLQLPPPDERSTCSVELDMGQKRLLGWLFGL